MLDGGENQTSVCIHCGKPIAQRHGKVSCAKSEDPTCHRLHQRAKRQDYDRRRKDQRQSFSSVLNGKTALSDWVAQCDLLADIVRKAIVSPRTSLIQKCVWCGGPRRDNGKLDHHDDCEACLALDTTRALHRLLTQNKGRGNNRLVVVSDDR
ncbi:MAG: hypothetical protein AMJ46_12485 [Latescibacteria bacterium DG_63]|nr:MAG: hypothetical protein AMJ46_12485 [Latescibacteria bacterium DG_63]